MAGTFGLIDQLDGSVNRLGAIQARVTTPVFAPTRTYLPRARLGSPGWWETLTGWIGGIEKWTGPLINLYGQLVQAGIITPAQAEQGLSKEELIELIRAMQPKPWYEQPWAPWVICGLASAGTLVGATVYYVAKKKR